MATKSKNKRLREYFKDNTSFPEIKNLFIEQYIREEGVFETLEEKRDRQSLRNFIRQKAFRYKIFDSAENHIKFYIEIRKKAESLVRYKNRLKKFCFPSKELQALLTKARQ